MASLSFFSSRMIRAVCSACVDSACARAYGVLDLSLALQGIVVDLARHFGRFGGAAGDILEPWRSSRLDGGGDLIGALALLRHVLAGLQGDGRGLLGSSGDLRRRIADFLDHVLYFACSMWSRLRAITPN